MADITFNELMSSDDVARIQAYTEHLDIPEDAYNKGCYYQNNHWYKDFYVYVNSQTITVKTLMAIETDPQGGYTLKARSIIAQNESSDIMQRIANGFSMAIDEESIEPVIDAFKNELRRGLQENDENALEVLSNLVDPTGNTLTSGYFINTPNSQLDFKWEELIDFGNYKSVDSSIINYLYDFFLKEFGDIGNIYKYNKITRQNGTGFITEWNNDVIPEVLAGSVKDGTITYGGYNSDSVYNIINDILSLNDTDIADVKALPIIRIGTRFTSPSRATISVSGIGLDSNKIEVSNNGALIYATVTYVKCIRFSLVDNTITKSVVYETPDGYTASETFKNTIRNESIDRYGITSGTLAQELYTDVIDSIGWTGNIAPYRLLDNDYPTRDKTPQAKYPEWIKPDTTPVGDSEPEPDPEPIRIGKPDPKKRVHPVQTKEPDPIPEDEPSPTETTENDPPHTKGILGSMYDLGSTDTKLNELAEFLYNPLNAERIAQFWKNDPTQSIVSLHYLYLKPESTGMPIIALGNVATNINAPEITNRYKTFDCGERAVERKFNNVMDYSTKISIYLPFSGIHPLNTEEVMNSKIHVKGSVDVITGDILYQLTVNRKQADGKYMTDNKCLYTFTGNCKVDIPYSSASFNKGGVGGILGNVLTGNLKGAFIGTVGTATSGFSDVTASGNLSGNSGAMGFKYPYLIIEYPKVVDVAERGKLFGHAANKTVRVSQVKGYAEFDRVHVDTISCSDQEKSMIENALKSGVII